MTAGRQRHPRRAAAEAPGRRDAAVPAGHGPVARSSGDSLAAGSTQPKQSPVPGDPPRPRPTTPVDMGGIVVSDDEFVAVDVEAALEQDLAKTLNGLA
jgi:hypothetical protein